MVKKEDLHLERIGEVLWRVSATGGMRTEGRIYASEGMMKAIEEDESLQQVANVAHLPGIVGFSLGMPDIHSGYGFPIGGVAAFDVEKGIVSPGGVGYDINCGVRLLRSTVTREELKGRLEPLVNSFYRDIPSGVGSHRKDLKLSFSQLGEVCVQGARWAVKKGFGTEEDLRFIEEGGCISGGSPDVVSQRAMERGRAQLGTLGSGNHFVEVDVVEEVLDEEVASVFGLFRDQIAVLIHTGSRGFGYQICDESIKMLIRAAQEHQISLPDRQLCCAPISSKKGRDYLAAMASAANFAFSNRQIISHWVREAFSEVFGGKLHLQMVYDVCHNIAKFETHEVEGKKVTLCVHRKGATRAFPPGHPHLPSLYSKTGQPVLIPGDMGRCSYVLAGTQKAYEETFGSACHGAGRVMSRSQAKRVWGRRDIIGELREKGIIARAASRATLVEEVPEAYKDVSEVVEVVHRAGIGKKVARLRPLGVIKG